MSQPSEPAPEELPLLAELSDAPPADALPLPPLVNVTPVPAMLAEPVPGTPAYNPPQPTIPIDRDRWFVEQQNGRRTGPLTWTELLGCVKAKMFFGDDLAYGEVNAHKLYLRDLFPTLAVRDPGPAPEQVPTAWQQLSHNPIETTFLGPEVGAYQKTDPLGAHYLANVRFIAILATFFLFCWLTGWFAVKFGFEPDERTAPRWMNVAAAIVFGLGLVQFTAALLEWEFVFTHRKIRWWRAWYGDMAARKYLLAISWVPMSLGFLLILLIVSMAWGS